MSTKERLAAALEALERHLSAVDETQAEQVASLEQLRLGLHNANNHLTAIKGALAELEIGVTELRRASEVDLTEIRNLQRGMAVLTDTVQQLTSETSNQYSQLAARVRTTEQLMQQQRAPRVGGG